MMIRWARKLAPSLATLSYNPVFRHVLPLGDVMPGLLFQEFRQLPPTYMTRHTFAHRIGAASVESLANPEAAVAYESAFLIDLCKRIGFSEVSIKTVKGEAQPLLLARK